AHVLADQTVAVALGGGGDGAHVHDGGDVIAMAGQPGHELVGADDVVQGDGGEVLPLVANLEPVDHHHPLAALGQGGGDVGADEAGAAGDDIELVSGHQGSSGAILRPA